jgi:hypothetical protein
MRVPAKHAVLLRFSPDSVVIGRQVFATGDTEADTRVGPDGLL